MKKNNRFGIPITERCPLYFYSIDQKLLKFNENGAHRNNWIIKIIIALMSYL